MARNELLPECPFYQRELGKAVVCEGLEPGSVVKLEFRRGDSLSRYKGRFCCSMNWESCPIAKILTAKYEG